MNATTTRVRQHNGFGHGLQPGTDHDMNCPSCRRERREHQQPTITGECTCYKAPGSAIVIHGSRCSLSGTEDHIVVLPTEPRQVRVWRVTVHEIDRVLSAIAEAAYRENFTMSYESTGWWWISSDDPYFHAIMNANT